MTPIRCTYCGRFYNKTKHAKRCNECEKQFRSVFESINKKYGVPIKQLAER